MTKPREWIACPNCGFFGSEDSARKGGYKNEYPCEYLPCGRLYTTDGPIDLKHEWITVREVSNND